MSDKTVKVNLSGTYRWDGKKYGPGQGVSVPAGMAQWLGAETVDTDTAKPEADTEPKPARRTAAKD